MFIDLSRHFAFCQTFIFTQIGISCVDKVNRPTVAAASGPGCYHVLVFTDTQQETMSINILS